MLSKNLLPNQSKILLCHTQISNNIIIIKGIWIHEFITDQVGATMGK